MHRPMVIAHRGWSGIYPENTMVAFRKAVELGCDGLETDVQLSSDGVPFLLHDETLDRTTTGAGYAKDLSYEELRRLDAGCKHGEVFKGETIPSLEELLEFVARSGVLVNLELKNSIFHYQGIEAVTYAMVRRHGLESRVIISTFDHYSLRACKSLDPAVKTGALYWDCLYEPYDYVKKLGADALHPEYHSLTRDIVERSHALDLEVNAYTVDDEADISLMIELGVDGIITDCPDKALALRDRLGAR